MGWGNLVIIRHIFLEDRQMKTVDSVYAHLDKVLVREGNRSSAGSRSARLARTEWIPAHLHFEIRKNLFIGYNQRAFAKDFSNYYVPTSFIAQRRKLHGAAAARWWRSTRSTFRKRARHPRCAAAYGQGARDLPASTPPQGPQKKRNHFVLIDSTICFPAIDSEGTACHSPPVSIRKTC
jgi:hypothetical protein